MVGPDLAKLAPATLAAFIVFTLGWIGLGRISPGFTLFGNHIAPYNWIAQPVSGLGLGKTAKPMCAAFMLTAVLLAIGLTGVMASLAGLSSAERLLFGAILFLTPVGCGMCGIFTLEQFMPHFAGFLIAMGAPILGFFLLGWRLSADPAYRGLGSVLICAAVATLVLLVGLLWSFDPDASGQGKGFAGLTQRLLITEVLGVFAFLGCSVGSATT